MDSLDLHGRKLILASGSPRRRELLASLNVPFILDTKTSFREAFDSGTLPRDVPRLMSEGKSKGFHRPLSPEEILITSDTMVILGNEIMGKPKDRDDARRMLHRLSGETHEVVTAVTFRDSERSKTISDTAKVHFRELTDREIDYYIDQYCPFDKAGAYGIQEWIGYVGITGIEGSFYTIMGFPVHIVYSLIEEFCGK